MNRDWTIEGASKDSQSITADWKPSDLRLIEGVRIRETVNVPKRGGYLTEIFRAEWVAPEAAVGQIFQVVLEPGVVSAWHAHAATIDRLFVTHGMVQIALYDGREGSPTFGLVNAFRFGSLRPALVLVPPRVWHGVQNVGSSPATVLNAVDVAYQYDDPDHWRVPYDSPAIPFAWSTGARPGWD